MLTSSRSRYDYAATLTSLGSKTCTQSTDARCTSAALTKLVGMYSSVKAAYCNDQYLVIATRAPVLPHMCESILLLASQQY